MNMNIERSFQIYISVPLSETVKPDGMEYMDGMESMKINCLNFASVHGAIVNLTKRKETKN